MSSYDCHCATDARGADWMVVRLAFEFESVDLSKMNVGGVQNPVQELASPLPLAPGLQGLAGSAKKAKTPKTPGEPRSKLRTEGGYLSVYDIINLVLEKEPGSDARDRFKGYRYL